MIRGFKVERDYVQITFPYHREDGDDYIVYAPDNYCTEDAPHRTLRLPKVAVTKIEAHIGGMLQCLIPYHVARRNELELFRETWSA